MSAVHRDLKTAKKSWTKTGDRTLTTFATLRPKISYLRMREPPHANVDRQESKARR